ncbi:MAG TPA: type II toxin-antitoxin system VapC family toxin [Solirubrobacterales bacterium]|nr:type II toxin-antitoxin system VapC family toxin [Solirubrobacterales bacterium]
MRDGVQRPQRQKDDRRGRLRTGSGLPVIFADSSFLIAAMDDRDPRHGSAFELLRRAGERRIVATNHIRGETWTWLRYKRWHRKAVEFLDSVGGKDQRIEIVRVTEDVEDDAFRWLREHDEREYSFVDATSFAYMRARGIQDALAFDGDFAAAGFTELRP